LAHRDYQGEERAEAGVWEPMDRVGREQLGEKAARPGTRGPISRHSLRFPLI